MSYTYKFGINPSTGNVNRILFCRDYVNEGITVSVSKGWNPDDQDTRPQDWTSEMLDVEYAKCDQVVGFTNLLQKRWQKRVARGATAEVVEPFTEE